MTKKEFAKKWNALIADLADGACGSEDDMDLGVGMDMAVHLSVMKNHGEDCTEIIGRLDPESAAFDESDFPELVSDAKATFPKRFE